MIHGTKCIFTHNECLIFDGFHVGKYTENVPWESVHGIHIPNAPRRTPAWFQAAHYADPHLGDVVFVGFSWQPENQVNSPIDMDNIVSRWWLNQPL